MPGKKRRGRSLPYLTPSPSVSPRELSPQPRFASSFRDRDTDSVMSASRPSSLAVLSSTTTHRPSLHEILSNTAPPPYTLAAFMAFLSQNHCLETLEFTMDVDRYASEYAEIMTGQDTDQHLCSLWAKMVNAYLVPSAPRELNLPAHVRDRLLAMNCHALAPHPSELDEAVRIVYELMNDSVLGPFLSSVAPPYPSCEEVLLEEKNVSRHGRTRLHIPHDSGSGRHEEAAWSPKTTFLPFFGLHKGDSATSGPHHLASSSAVLESAELGLTDDTCSTTSPRDGPVTPPTTPPAADWGLPDSPNTIQRAIHAHNTGWKRMSEKLGLAHKGGRSKRSSTRSITSGVPKTDGSSNVP